MSPIFNPRESKYMDVNQMAEFAYGDDDYYLFYIYNKYGKWYGDDVDDMFRDFMTDHEFYS